MTVSASKRRFVLERADGCCEYCLLSATSGTIPFHVDHIIPLKHAGTDEDDNLCFACFNCNTFKSHDLTGIDPDTGAITPLFHPRQQEWNDHFSLSSDQQIVGLTATGRTTVQVLKMNLEERMEARRLLSVIGEYPCKKV